MTYLFIASLLPNFPRQPFKCMEPGICKHEDHMNVEPVSKKGELKGSSVDNAKDLAFERPRLEPIEKPKGLMLRFVYRFAPRQYGKVPTNLKVLVARAPKTMSLLSAVGKYEMKGVRLEKQLHYMIAMFVAGTNGCGFCLDFGRMMAVKDNMSMEKFNALLTYRTSPLFSEKERAALSYVEEITRNKRVADDTFEELRKHYSDWEIVEITTLTAISNFENLLNIPLGIGSDGLCAIAQGRKK
ncbi:MAG: carboxymuconolactone decarboxylase family protein [Nitrososphaerota archaeon]|nr:carboxymuconolactone decarboxylase family protein [Nitrososphaerota archaeon]